VAAASLGQVYRGTWQDGRAVAVKVQYPFAAAALRADLRALSVALHAAGALAPGLVAAPLVGELRERAVEELDYRHEARAQAAAAEAFAASPDYVVPAVVQVADGVLVSEWVDGRPLVDVAHDPADVRALVASRYQRFALECPRVSGWLHADPHPGNFRVMADGRLGVLDFGAVVSMPAGLPRAFGHLVRIFADGGADADVTTALRSAGLLRPGRSVDVRSLASVMSPFGEPARHDTFAFGADWLRSRFAKDPGARDPDYTVALGLSVPAEHLMTQRVWLGVIGVLCRLEVEIPVRPVLQELLPGFSPSDG
jgi:predicted unusual protein kinase regulating ubiquinone biosynthesis (AarF/ABC1/UbiB family)